MKIMNINMN